MPESTKDVPEKLTKPYNPNETEGRIYDLWEKSGYFNPDNLPPRHKEPFSMVLPPPNVTGVLHLGHALEDSLQDAIVRYKRMRGYKTLWIPGTDHAAIATQSKVAKQLEKEESMRPSDIGREKFLKRVEKFATESHDTIVKQVRRMGASLDWTREAFTLDDERGKAVIEAFERMYEEGLIYRGHRIVNWDPKGQTTISDDEVVHEERLATLYTFKYSPDFPIAISTTRPETKVGDTAVAVHPNDTRYIEFIGKEYNINFAGNKLHIKIVADESVEREFGTGALGVTPAHSQIDWEIAERHGLEKVQVIDGYAKMTELAGPLVAGKKVLEAREIVVNWLNEHKLMAKEPEEVKQNVATAERTGGVIEPLPKLQWFVGVNKSIKSKGGKTLKDLMRDPVANGEIKIMPEHEEKKYFNWVDNLRDWCISRQIWYGHRVPAWYCGFCSNTREKLDVENGSYVSTNEVLVKRENAVLIAVSDSRPNSCLKCGDDGQNIFQDPDTLDTWFSSALWSFSTLGWPEKTKLLETYHPNSLINPGYEILFFWLARMIMMSQFLLGEVPFKTALLHGILRDKKGQKFSKSLGNGVDPIEIIEKYGADALRMSLIVSIAPGMDSNFDEQKVLAYKKFANKIWNISRFVIENDEDDLGEIKYTPEDQRVRNMFELIVKDVTKNMENYRFYIASEEIYHYTWHKFADLIIEGSKGIFKDGDVNKIKSRKKLQKSILVDCLKLLHPFMPFVTEEIWGIMHPHKHKEGKLLMIEPWPIN